MPHWLGWVFRLICPSRGVPVRGQRSEARGQGPERDWGPHESGLQWQVFVIRTFIGSRRELFAPTSDLQPLPMKLIIAIIQPSKLEDVKAALSEREVVRLTIMDVQGFGRQKGQTEVYRGHEITVNLLRKVQLMIAVNDHFVEPTIEAIIKGGRTGPTGEIGDGKIFVLPLEDCIRIRTGERGGEAI
jgi:nitrogen regulatory protein P-II 2